MKLLYSLISIVMVASSLLAADVDPRAYGARGDGQAKDTAAIQKAIDAAAAAGGGRVVLSPGTYLSGTIYLKSNIEFHLSAGAVLLGSPDQADYPYTVGGRHLVYIYRQDRVSIAGKGRIDGNAKALLKPDSNDPTGKKLLRKGATGWRADQMVYIFKSAHISIRDVELVNPTFWTCYLAGCDDFRIDGVTVSNHVANGDGFSMSACHRGVIANCRIESGDDSIVVRARNENIVVKDCALKSACDAVIVGVDNGLIKDCAFSNLTIRSSPFGIALFPFYSGPQGTPIENVRFDTITIDARIPIAFRFTRELLAPPETKIRNVSFKNIRATGRETCCFGGTPDNKLIDISFSDIVLTRPEGAKPFQMLKFSHIDGLTLENVRVPDGDSIGMEDVTQADMPR